MIKNLDQLLETGWDIQMSFKKDICNISLNHFGGFSLRSSGKTPNEALNNFEEQVNNFDFTQELPIDGDELAPSE